MSFIVGEGKNSISVNTLPQGNRILFGEKEISMEEFCSMVNYVLCNSELTGEDPRLELLADIKSLKVVSVMDRVRLIGDRPSHRFFCNW